ncbi:MFS transporter [Novosphingobium sp. KACC 22771]|uniref:MFS transporter n=1 Tax=Novosphingobium sp. KACC 22771 TaxID=3025670 RepID=UPI0023650183|nr:MFS transporter [Novosphingobium sp. KACC 22771]WDF73230.1 MFS transporter [Novosphingobium sp. KACC 22771]
MSRRFHPAFLVAAITFLALLVSAGVRSAPSVMIVPLQLHFGWDRASISATAALGIFLYGLVGPFAAALMMSVGVRRVMMVGLALMGASALASQYMTQAWQFTATWGVVSGLGTGMVASVLGATIVNRWFARNQGLVMGIFAASTATGSLIFLPFLAWLTQGGAWVGVVRTVGIACLALVPLVAWLVPESPVSAGVGRFGEEPGANPPRKQSGSPLFALQILWKVRGNGTFWLLFGTFFVCGLTTNGLVGTHLIAFCGDHGIAPVAAAGLLSLMGLFDLVGTTASGWLTDRHNPRYLLAVYYGLRGLSLIALPFMDFGPVSLGAFAIFYGLDWIATVPPTLAIANRSFGEGEAPVVFGWVAVGHQVGAAVAAFGGGLVRQEWGSYSPAFMVAGVFGLVAALAMIVARDGQKSRLAAVAAPL